MDKLKSWSSKRSRSTTRSSNLSRASTTDREWEERRRSASDRECLVYHRRTEEERQALAEREAARGMVDLGDGIVYASVMGLPAPTAPVRGTNPVMSQLPRRTEGMHPRLWSNQAIAEGRYTSATEILPKMVPDRLVPDVTASICLMRIKKGWQGFVKKIKKQ
jgi:hypothetical protein